MTLTRNSIHIIVRIDNLETLNSHRFGTTVRISFWVVGRMEPFTIKDSILSHSRLLKKIPSKTVNWCPKVIQKIDFSTPKFLNFNSMA